MQNGVDTNGGGYKPGASGTDYSQQNAAQYALTNVTTAAANAILLTASAAADMVGNIAQIVSGTNFTAGFYEITSVSVGVSITVDRNCTTAAGASGVVNIGGALLTIGKCNTIMTTSGSNTAGQTFWVKNDGGLSISAAITFSPTSGSGSNITQMNAYTTTRGDNGQATITATGGSGYTMWTTSPSSVGVIIRNIVLDGNSRTSIKGCSLQGTNCLAKNWLVKNCTNGGISMNNRNNIIMQCRATANAGGGGAIVMENSNGSNYAIDCIADTNTVTGFSGNDFVAIRCISANNTGGSTDGFGGMANNTGSLMLDHCVAYTNGRNGFNFNSSILTPIFMSNCIGYGNVTKDINYAGTLQATSTESNYNFYATQTGYTAGANDVVITVDPFTNGASLNFALNNTAGGGAAIRGAGFPGVLTTGGTGYADGGALQHQDSATSTVYVISANIKRFLRTGRRK